MFVNCVEMLAYGPIGAETVRQMRFPEDGSWVAFDCDKCGHHTEQPIYGALECEGCDAYAPVAMQVNERES